MTEKYLSKIMKESKKQVVENWDGSERVFNEIGSTSGKKNILVYVTVIALLALIVFYNPFLTQKQNPSLDDLADEYYEALAVEEVVYEENLEEEFNSELVFEFYENFINLI